jgi:hypothetical protein
MGRFKGARHGAGRHPCGYPIMQYVMFAAAAMLAAAAVNAAHAQNGPSSIDALGTASTLTGTGVPNVPTEQVGTGVTSLSVLLAEWDRAGFVPPSKPGQYRVYGWNGYVTSGPGYNAMVSLIRSAVNDVREGRARVAKTKIASARGLLAAASPAPEYAAH